MTEHVVSLIWDAWRGRRKGVGAIVAYYRDKRDPAIDLRMLQA